MWSIGLSSSVLLRLAAWKLSSISEKHFFALLEKEPGTFGV